MARLRCCVAVGDRQRLFLQNHCLIQLQMLPIGSGSLHLRLILLASDILARQAVVRIFFSPAFFLFSYALPGRRPTRQLHTTFAQRMPWPDCRHDGARGFASGHRRRHQTGHGIPCAVGCSLAHLFIRSSSHKCAGRAFMISLPLNIDLSILIEAFHF